MERGARPADFGTPDWDELMRVIKGGGPCNAQRVERRRSAHEDGDWVRQAAAAHAAKNKARAAGRQTLTAGLQAGAHEGAAV